MRYSQKILYKCNWEFQRESRDIGAEAIFKKRMAMGFPKQVSQALKT